ncbi:MAG TPA: PepSY-associated TM helix domain-containing protein [Cellvibrionaceae bacterium]
MKIKTRPLLVLWHRWFGLLAGLWIVALAATGSAIVFYDELDRALNPDLHKVKAGAEPLPIKTLISAATTYKPDAFVRFINMPNDPGSSIRLSLGARPDASHSDADGLSLYLDPYTANIIGERRAGELRLDRRHVMNVIYELHIDFLLGQTVFWLLGLVAFLWLIDHFISLIISFKKLSKWAKSFKIRFSSGGYKRLFDLHRAGGLWLFPITLMLTVSGLYFNWYDTVTHAVDKVSPLTPRTIFTLPNIGQSTVDTPIDLASAMSLASEASASGRINMASFLPHKGVFEVRAFDARDIDPYGRQMIVIDAQNGAVLSNRHITEGGAGNVFIAWQYPLHSGKAFGWAGRIVIFITGLMIILLCVTGIKIAWRKRAAVRQKLQGC